MPTIETIQGSSLVPNFADPFAEVAAAFTQKSRENKIGKATETILSGGAVKDESGNVVGKDTAKIEKAIRRLAEIGTPQQMQFVLGITQMRDAKEAAEAKAQLENAAKTALFLSELSDSELSRELNRMAQKFAADGVIDLTESRIFEISQIEDVARQRLELNRDITTAGDLKTMVEARRKALEPKTDIAKANQDFEQGNITEEQHSQLVNEDKFTNVKIDDEGKFFGLNNDGLIEEIPFTEGSGSFTQSNEGTSLSVGADGSISFTTGGAEPIQTDTQTLTDPNQTKQQEQLLNARAGLSRITAIQNSLDPKFLTIGNKFKNLITSSLKADFNPDNLSAEDRQELEEFAIFRANTVRNLNNYIKEITGAQLSAQEAQRLIQGLPNAGTKTGIMGVFEGDNPVIFMGKLKSITAELKLAVARSSLNLGFGVPLEDVKGIVQQRATEIENNVRQQNPSLDDTQIKQIVQAEVRQLVGF